MPDPKYMGGVLTSRKDVSTDLWIVRIRPEDKIPFSPGQYVTVGLPKNGRMVERPYSVASSPTEAELEFFIEVVPDGELTPNLHEVPVGGEVFFRRSAKGRFLLDEKTGHRNHFMMATVTGVAPFVSMLRSLGKRAGQGETVGHQIVLLEAASLASDLGYDEELAAYARSYEWFHYIPTVSRIWQEPAWGGERGRAEDVARKHLDGFGFGPTDTTAYVCGHPNMIENAKGVFERAGFPKESVKEELYWVAAKAA